MQSYVIGIDIGTSSTKAVAIDDSGKVIATSRDYYPTMAPMSGYSEQDPQLIWEAYVKSIQSIVYTVGCTPKVITLSSCMHSLIVVDNNDTPITPSITWADSRSENIARNMRASTGAENIYTITGTPIHAMSPLCKIIWIHENMPEVYAQAKKFISIKEYIWFQLFQVYEIDHSIASSTGLFDISHCVWYDVSMNLCEINADQLSSPVATDYLRNSISATIASLLQIDTHTQFCIGASDGCMAMIGSMANRPGIASVTVGTSGAVRICSPKPVYNFPGMTFNYILDNNTIICGGPVNNGGNLIEWLFKSFITGTPGDEAAYKNIFITVESVIPGSEGLIFLPYLHGERAPMWDERACGVYFGIRSHHEKSHFLRATAEGICYGLLHVLEQLDGLNGSVNQLNVSGAIVQSATWLQILADITGKKICVSHGDDASALGAAVFGMKAISPRRNDDYLVESNDLIIQPNMKNHAVYEKYYKIFKSLSSSSTDFMHQLYDLNS
ncbi:MAG: gluconokinase [Ginsengibacter sp.]